MRMSAWQYLCGGQFRKEKRKASEAFNSGSGTTLELKDHRTPFILFFVTSSEFFICHDLLTP